MNQTLPEQFQKGEIIEAIEPESLCWLTAIFHKQIATDTFEIEWYDDVLKRSHSTPTIIVNEIQKKHFRESSDVEAQS